MTRSQGENTRDFALTEVDTESSVIGVDSGKTDFFPMCGGRMINQNLKRIVESFSVISPVFPPIAINQKGK